MINGTASEPLNPGMTRVRFTGVSRTSRERASARFLIMLSASDHSGERHRSDYRGERGPITVRTDPEHKRLFVKIAKDNFGLSTNDFFALVMAQVCGLERPARCPAVPIDLATLSALAEQAREALAAEDKDAGEVLSKTA